MEETNEYLCGPRMLKAYLDKVTGPNLEELRLTPSSAPFLGEIAQNEGASLKLLSELLMVDKAHTTRVISKLIDSGLVENRAEGHEYSLYLTETGIVAWKRSKIIMEEAWEDLLKDLTPEERKTLRGILEKIARVVREAEQ